MQEQKISLSKNPTTEQIAECKKAVKAKFGESAEVFKYEVDGKHCYLRSVDRNTYSAAAAKVSTSPAKFNEIVINQIWLGGDDEIKNNDQYYFGLVEFVEELMGKKGQPDRFITSWDKALSEATGKFEDNNVRYINIQLMYHLGLSKSEIESMDDETWAEHYAILENIRKEEAKQKPF